jgi:RimJ/RimL family protein N-acetyltransferase
VDPEVVTERLALRRFERTDADIDHLARLHGDARVMRYIGDPSRSRREIEQTTLPAMLDIYARHPGFGRWAAEVRDGGGFVGWLSLRPVVPTDAAMMSWPTAPPSDTRVVMLGYRLQCREWGRGYATEGARALVAYAFRMRAAAGAAPVDRIVATAMAVNAGSRRVMEKAGLCYLRTVRLDWPDPLPGNEHGDVEYEITRTQWAAARR